MVKLTGKHRTEVNESIEAFRRHCIKFPKKTVNSRGKLFWGHHPAKNLLIQDTKSGKASNMKPKELWKSRKEYGDFSLDDFRKHIYQEKYRQLAGPYWQKKRNKLALKQHQKKIEQLYQEWLHNKWEDDMTDLTRDFAAL